MSASAEIRVAAQQDVGYLPDHLLRWELEDGRVLRLADLDEYDEVGRVLQAAFTTGCSVTEWYHDHLAVIAPRAQTAHVWVVADADGILGAVLTPKPQFHSGDAFTFNILGVGPRGRGLRIGRALVEHSIALARFWGYSLVEIHSGPTMTAAHQLYVRYGFVRRLEWETVVVDSGQRLLSFTYRIPDPLPRPDITPEEPPQSRPDVELEEPTMNLIDHLPPGDHGEDGEFRAHPPRLPGPVVLHPELGYRLVTSLDAVRGRAALTSRRLADATEQIEVVAHPDAITPLLYDDRGQLISDDWRYFGRSILGSSDRGRAYYPEHLREEVDTLDLFLHTDLIGGLERAIFAGSDESARAAQRIVYARLGELDRRVAGRRYLLGDVLTEADVALFAVLVGFDLEYRAHLGWGAAALVDYPNLWAYARGLLQTTGFADDSELVAVGLLPEADGGYSRAWGEVPPVEGLADLRTAWLDDDDRAGLGAA